jgi:RHS repeat-associated protein
MLMPGRGYSATGAYRYGFNGKENDNEVKGEGNQQDYGMRIYDPRLGRFLSVDPITKSYPMLTPYQFASNSPIASIDLDGKEGLVATGMPNLVDGRPTGLVVTSEMALEINRNAAVAIFKSAFTEELPRKFIDHYANEGGKSYRLSMSEMKSLNVTRTGIQGRVKADISKFSEKTSKVGFRDRGKARIIHFSNYKIQGAANVGGTLGRFTIEIEGRVTYDKNDKSKWLFEGKMRYYDIYDFETETSSENDLQRSDWGNLQTEIARRFLPGQAFEITSDWIAVRQTNEDEWFDYFNKTSVESKQNRVSNELQKPVENNKDHGSTREINDVKSDL